MPPEAHERAAEPPEGTATRLGLAANPCARSRRTGPFIVVEVSGEIDMATAGLVAAHLALAAESHAPDVLVDLRRVTFFDCSGLRVLCRAEARARKRGGRLRLVTEQPRLHRLLRAARLLGRFPPLPELPELPELPAGPPGENRPPRPE